MSMISYSDAQQQIAEAFARRPAQHESVVLTDACGRVLAESVVADVDIPAFDNAAMDGYAVAFDERITAWIVCGECSAGNFSPLRIERGDAAGIMTGAMLPDGCDTVVPFEDVVRDGRSVTLKGGSRFQRGMHVKCKGEESVHGATVIAPGTLLTPRHIAAAAACGRTTLAVETRCTVGVLSTGDELIEASDIPRVDRVRASNAHALCASCAEMNVPWREFGIVKDVAPQITDAIAHALTGGIDILLITGGVSVGTHDHVREAMTAAGVTIQFAGVEVKPGKPLVFGVDEASGRGTLVFGLPGNPASALTAYEVFVREHLLARAHRSGVFRHITATLTAAIAKRGARRHFLPGCAAIDAGRGFVAAPIAGQPASGLVRMGSANCFIVIGETMIDPREGERVECIMI